MIRKRRKDRGELSASTEHALVNFTATTRSCELPRSSMVESVSFEINDRGSYSSFNPDDTDQVFEIISSHNPNPKFRPARSR